MAKVTRRRTNRPLWIVIVAVALLGTAYSMLQTPSVVDAEWNKLQRDGERALERVERLERARAKSDWR